MFFLKVDMMRVIRQIYRGCGTLPHVGEHPGTVFLLMFIIMGAFAGVRGGIWGVLVGAVAMFVFIGPLYFWGAYDRAQLSDKLEGRRR